MPVIEVRKLAAVDMVWLGKRIVVAEYALGVVLPLALGIFSIRVGVTHESTWQTIIGAWLVTIAANYVPLLLYAWSIMRAGTVEQEGRPELARARRYGIQQSMILVPLLVVGVAVAQEHRRQRQGKSR
jgi:hypothetical protein